ncbi:phage tail protein [Pseudomonas monteilii]|uniref:phage tail protein n=1 Tax=Pseudomonas monteilii TaxID=76759 RepID=UPI0018E348BE|nr:phage tail protein [Pseudomonas monteilii]
MPWYRTGTVAITAGQTTVTGTGTNFSANARVGDALLGPDGNWYEVTNIASGTVLSILPAYKGATVAGGTYAIAPVQGYTKTLADKFNDIANTWGSTLAGLGSVSTENVVPVAKGGTGGTTQAAARSGLGLKSAAVADIVGPVSQSGGTPTGAIIERGSNANGQYTKYADGSMACWQVLELSYSSGSMLLATWTFPAPFASALVVEVTVIQGQAADISPVTFGDIGQVMVASMNLSSCSPRIWKSSSVSSNFPTTAKMSVNLLAKGRWF